MNVKALSTYIAKIFKVGLLRPVVLYGVFIFLFNILLQKDLVAPGYLNDNKHHGEFIEQYVRYDKPFVQERFLNGAAYYKMVSHTVPSPALAFSNMGFCYYYLHDIDQAIQAFQKAIILEPGVHTFYYDMGIISMRSRQYQLAVEFFNKSQVRLPLSKEELVKRFAIKDPERRAVALKYSDHLLRRAKFDQEQIIHHLVTSYYHLKDYRKMTEFALHGARAYSHDAEFYYHAGLGYFLQEQYDKALPFFNHALQLQPRYAQAYYQYGLALRKLGNELFARVNLQKAEAFQDNGWQKPEPLYRELHFYHDSGIFFKAYSVGNEMSE